MKMRSLSRFGLAVAFALAAAPLLAQYEERAIGGIGITVFRDENFRGQNATFRSDVPDLRRFGFSDRITSLRVAPGEYWEACERANYQGRCQVFSGDERDLRRVGWTDRISSLRRVRGGGGGGGGYPGPRPPGSRRGIVLYDDPYFRGNSLPINRPIDNLRFQSFHDRAESVRVVSGRWELCAEPGFRRCQIVDRDVPNLSALGLNKKLSSVRPVGFVPGGPGGGGGYPPPYPEAARLVLFEGPGYRGQSVTLDSASAILSGISGRARSVQVVSGTWQLCDGPRFSGRCQEISSSVPDLDRWGQVGRVMSARPVRGY
jgi:beta/gamma crystallin